MVVLISIIDVHYSECQHPSVSSSCPVHRYRHYCN